MMNILNGGAHADNGIDFQEFMIMPVELHRFPNPSGWEQKCSITWKAVLKKKGLSTNVGDEGGFAPNLKSNEEAIQAVMDAIGEAGYGLVRTFSRHGCRFDRVL